MHLYFLSCFVSVVIIEMFIALFCEMRLLVSPDSFGMNVNRTGKHLAERERRRRNGANAGYD
jgi:hypothetical protein